MPYVVKVNGNIVSNRMNKIQAQKKAESLREDRKRLPSKSWMKSIRVVKHK